MKKRSSWMQGGIVLIVMLLMTALALPATAMAQQKGNNPKDPGWVPPGQGKKDDGGGGGGGGGGGLDGNLYADPYVAIRDMTANGEPILFWWDWTQNSEEVGAAHEDDEDGIPFGAIPRDFEADVPEGCVQPFSWEPLPIEYEEDGRIEWVSFPYHHWINSYGNEETVYLIPLDDECKIPDVYEDLWKEYVVEIEAGRLNFARTTQYVIDMAYVKTLETLNQAAKIDGMVLGLDPAGRLFFTTGENEEFTIMGGDEIGDGMTIDSPRENLALYQELMRKGCLSERSNRLGRTQRLSVEARDLLGRSGLGHLVCPLDANGNELKPGPDNDDLLRAAGFIAGAADKFGRVHVDMVIFINSVLDINKVNINVDTGAIEMIEYFDFGNFTYNRAAVHTPTRWDLLQPYGQEAPPTLWQTRNNFWFYDKIFKYDWDGINDYPQFPIVNFVRAVDDALATIFYIHEYEVPQYITNPIID